MLSNLLTSSQRRIELLAALQQLLSKRVITLFLEGERFHGFHSNLFNDPKAKGGIRHILDLKMHKKLLWVQKSVKVNKDSTRVFDKSFIKK